MFQQLGFYKEYYIDGKFIGSLKCENDGQEIGYEGRKTIILEEKITLDNKKVIKAKTEVMILMYPLCGSLIKN